MDPAIFIDRDGVINENPPAYVKSWEEFLFLPGVLKAMKILARCPWPIIVITNQSVVGRGIIERKDLDEIHAIMKTTIENAGGRVDAVFVCPHHPDDGCACRKPAPGLLLDAAGQMHLDLSRSVLLGDNWSDVRAALQSGAQPVLVCTNQESHPAEQIQPVKVPMVKDLMGAASALKECAQQERAPADVIYYLTNYPCPDNRFNPL